MAHHDLVATVACSLPSDSPPQRPSSVSALQLRLGFGHVSTTLRCHLKETVMRGDVTAQHLMISVMGSEGDHTFGPDPSASCLII